MNTILFSGRFDKPHAGHIITIQRLGQVYDKVIVCVLDYPEAKQPLWFRMNVLSEVLLYSKGNYLVISNNVNFGKITHSELKDLPPHTNYGTGNLKVFDHMLKISKNILVEYIPRYPGYAASKEEE